MAHMGNTPNQGNTDMLPNEGNKPLNSDMDLASSSSNTPNINGNNVIINEGYLASSELNTLHNKISPAISANNVGGINDKTSNNNVSKRDSKLIELETELETKDYVIEHYQRMLQNALDKNILNENVIINLKSKIKKFVHTIEKNKNVFDGSLDLLNKKLNELFIKHQKVKNSLFTPRPTVAVIQELDAMSYDYDNEKETIIKYKDDIILMKDSELNEKNEFIQKQMDLIHRKDSKIDELTVELDELTRDTKEKDNELLTLNDLIDKYKINMNTTQETIKEKNEIIQEQSKIIDDETKKMEDHIKKEKRKRDGFTQNEYLKQFAVATKEKDNVIHTQNIEIQRMKIEMEEMQLFIDKQQKMMQTKIDEYDKVSGELKEHKVLVKELSDDRLKLIKRFAEQMNYQRNIITQYNKDRIISINKRNKRRK